MGLHGGPENGECFHGKTSTDWEELFAPFIRQANENRGMKIFVQGQTKVLELEFDSHSAPRHL